MSIESVFLFDTEGAAKADSVVGAYWISSSNDSAGGWRADVCVPSLRAWDSRQDVLDNNGSVAHQYWPGWRICIGTEDVLPEFLAHPAIVLVSDNVKRERDHRPIEEWLIYKPALIALADIPYLVISPQG